MDCAGTLKQREQRGTHLNASLRVLRALQLLRPSLLDGFVGILASTVQTQQRFPRLRGSRKTAGGPKYMFSRVLEQLHTADL